MDDIIQDLRYALRNLSNSPEFLTIAVLTLALGIGANVAIFTLVNAYLLQPSPFHEADRLVRIFDDLGAAGSKNVGMSVPELEDLRERSGVFEQISAISPVSTALSGGDRVERIEALGTIPSYFEMLGAKAALGRVYGQADWVPGFVDGVVISDGLWKREFGGDPHVIGRRIRVDEDGYTIIGVMPPDFRHPGETFAGDVELWAAAGFLADPFPSPPMRARRSLPGAMGRMIEVGIMLKQAQQRLDALTAQLQRAIRTTIFYNRAAGAPRACTSRSVTAMCVLLSSFCSSLSVSLLLMVCVNIASLLIAPSSARTREFAIGRHWERHVGGWCVRRDGLYARLIRRWCGCNCRATLRAKLSARLDAGYVPRLAEVHSDWRALSLALMLSITTGILFRMNSGSARIGEASPILSYHQAA